MPVINETTGFTYGVRDFTKTTRHDCDSGNKRAWDEIIAANERIEKLRKEAADWLNLRDAIEAYEVETAGELPENIYKRHKTKLDRPPILVYS